MNPTASYYWKTTLEPVVPQDDKEAIIKLCIVIGHRWHLDIDDLIQTALLAHLETKGNMGLVKKAINACINSRPTGRRAKLTAQCLMEFCPDSVQDDLHENEVVLDAFSRLDVTEQIVVWFLEVVEVSQTDLAKALHLTQSQISRTRIKALATMRSSL